MLDIKELRTLALEFVQKKNIVLQNKYTEFQIVQDLEYSWWLEYYQNTGTPFIDIMYYPFIFQEDNIYIDIKQYTDALNQVLRTYVIRIKDDGFAENFSKELFNFEIDNKDFKLFIDNLLELKKNLTFKEIYQKIVFNESIIYITELEVLNLFKELSRIGLVTDLHNDQYFKLKMNLTVDEFKVFQFNENIDLDTNSFKESSLGSKKIQMFYLKNYRKILNLNSINIIPPKDSGIKMNINKIFFYVNKEVVFLPQFLIFKGIK